MQIGSTELAQLLVELAEIVLDDARSKLTEASSVRGCGSRLEDTKAPDVVANGSADSRIRKQQCAEHRQVQIVDDRAVALGLDARAAVDLVVARREQRTPLAGPEWPRRDDALGGVAPQRARCASRRIE